jgi:hypothetical protein
MGCKQRTIQNYLWIIMKITIIIITALLLSLLIFGIWNFNQPPVPLAKLSLLKKGMSVSEVEGVVGRQLENKYTKQTEAGTNYVEWCYTRPASWSIIYIIFDENDTYKEYDYDY